jgi:hypothetical protein
MNYKKEYNENGFTIMDNFLPVENYNKMIKIYNSSKFIEIHTIRKNRYKRWETLEDKNFPSADEIYEASYWSSNEIVNNEYYKNIFNEHIRPLFLRLHSDTGIFRHQATRVKNNNKNFIRTHYDDYMGDTGYILYLTELDWKYDWGGQLQIVSNGKIETILPIPNKLILINHFKKMTHWVNPVTRWAKEDRDNINGFCIKGSQELPDTWTGDRDDYAVY